MINLASIYYKFSFEKNFTKSFINKDFITLNELKIKLIEKALNTKNNSSFYNKKLDFDYEITNVHTNKIITDSNELIHKNTYLSVKRIVNLSENELVNTAAEIYKPNQAQFLKDEESKLLNSILNESMNQMIICRLCKQPGHVDRNCPVKGTALKPPSGIPRTKWLEIGPEKKIMTPVEYSAIRNPKKEDILFLDDDLINIKPFEVKRKTYPDEFKCPFGDHIIQDAVLLPCCGKFFCCNSCILNKISQNEPVECVNKNCNQEMGSYQFITSSDYLRNKIKNHLINLNKFEPAQIKRTFNKNENHFNQSKKVKFPQKPSMNQNQTLIDQFLGIKKRKSNSFNENLIKKQKIQMNF